MSEFPKPIERVPSEGKKNEIISRELYDKIRKRTQMLMRGKFNNFPKSAEDDIVQLVAIKILRYGLPEYEAQLTNMVKHSMITELRKHKNQVISLETGGKDSEGNPASLMEQQPHSEDSLQIHNHLLVKEVLKHVRGELKTRDPEWTTIFQRYFLDHESGHAIAEEIGWEQSKVHRTIQTINEIISKFADFERPGE